MITDTGMAFMFLIIFIAAMVSVYGVFGNKNASKSHNSENAVYLTTPARVIEFRSTYVVSDAEVDGMDIAQDRAEEYITEELLKSVVKEIHYSVNHNSMTGRMEVTATLKILRGDENEGTTN